MSFDVFFHDPYVTVSASGRWAVIGFSFVFGAVIGSFMNVVVYRLPRGMSLVRPGSQCPACGHPIRWHDNLPILGWLWLGGRCRDCHAPISVRYPLVEALAAATSALLGWTALVAIAPGADFPIDERVFSFGFVTYGFHFLLTGVLICAALIEFDGHAPSASMLCGALVIGFAIGSVWPEVRLSTAWPDEPWHGAYDGAAGLLAAVVLGALAWPSCVARASKSDVRASVALLLELALVGTYLGAREVATIAAAGALCYGAARFVGRLWQPANRIGWATWLAVITPLGIVTWPWRLEAWPWLADRDELTIVILAGGVVAFVSMLRAVDLIRPRSRAL